MATLFVDKLDPQSGPALEIGSSGDTITIPSGATLTNNGTATGFGGTNSPRFLAIQTADQIPGHNTTVKISFSNEIYDVGSCYDPTTNYRFTVPAGEGGLYQVSMMFWMYDSAGSLQVVTGYIYKNGSLYINETSSWQADQHGGSIGISAPIELSAADYLEAYAYVQESGASGAKISGSGTTSNYRNFFSAYKMIT